MATPSQAEQDNQQPAGDDTCGERCVAMALELAGAFQGADAGKAFVDAAWQAVVDADAPGTLESERGTTLAEERRVIDFGAQRFGFTTTPTPIDSQELLVAACRMGFYAVVGVRLGDLLPDMISNHFVLAYATDGTNITVVDPAHDIDGAWLFSHDVYTLSQVVRGGYDLFGQGQPFGWAFGFSKQENPMDEATQQAMIEMEARQNAALTEMWKRFRQGKFSGADGIDGKIVELQGGTPLDFVPSYPPNS